MRKFKLSVQQYTEKLEKNFGFASKILVKEYAEARQKWKKELQYQEGVLGRMVESGCKSCEKKRQEDYIQSLKEE